ncbi:uncharacterized protein LOC113468216 [Diaphorina citri]|uniref:Uncharacterized protein LOC113468216 n=1 Tax=Diaphorina citri TaxID=121845 RepID=A0A3Q0J243_DIACI|nr:uncharacterized protein LOC113468216 [Diaphorina citri]
MRRADAPPAICEKCARATKSQAGSAKEVSPGKSESEYKNWNAKCGINDSGADGRGRNGVGIVLDKDMKTKVTNVSRRSDRVMSVKLQLEDKELNIVCAYAPQVGCEDEEKDDFWMDIEREIVSIPTEERVFFGGDLNGHIGKRNSELTARITA